MYGCRNSNLVTQTTKSCSPERGWFPREKMSRRDCSPERGWFSRDKMSRRDGRGGMMNRSVVALEL